MGFFSICLWVFTLVCFASHVSPGLVLLFKELVRDCIDDPELFNITTRVEQASVHQLMPDGGMTQEESQSAGYSYCSVL